MIQTKLFGSLKLKKPQSLKAFDKEIKASSHIPFSHFVTPSIIATRNGDLAAVMKVQGISFEVKDADEINQLQANLSFLLQNLGSEYAVYITLHRHPEPAHLENDYPDGFAKNFVTAYQQQFKDAQLFVNDIYLTVLHREIKPLKKFSLSKKKLNQEEWQQAQKKRIQQFESTITQVLQSLSAYSPHLLEIEILSFLSLLVNGKAQDFTYPYQDIAGYIPNKRLFFGYDTLHVQGTTKQDNRFAAMLSVKAYSPTTSPGLLNNLLTLPCEIISTHSFLPITTFDALKQIELLQKRFASTDDAAISQLEELHTAKDDVVSNRLCFGLHHNTILLLSDDMKSLDEKVALIIKCYQDKRLNLVRETLNLENAFWAQIPGNFKYNRRQALISSHNFSCFCSLHNYYTGYKNQNHLGDALMLMETPSKTPFYFNLHEKASGRKDDLSKGHTILIGPSNAGKTVVMTAIDAMFKKYNARSFFIDRNCGCEIYVRAMSGHYFRLTPGISTGWNPFQLNDNSENRSFLRDFLKVLSYSETKPLTSLDEKQIADVVDRNFSLPFEQRNLSNIAQFLRLDFSGMDALSRYLRSGDKGYLFDNDFDNLSFDTHTIGFDMTHWLNSDKSPDELLPINMYLFHRIQQSLDGTLTGLYLDEGWQFLQQSYWLDKLNEYLVTWRKLNAFVFFATQLPDKVAKSPLASALIQGTATHIFLANPKASKEDYIDGFKLTAKEFEIVKTLEPTSHYFLIKQQHESAIARIHLQGLEPYLRVLSGTQKTVEQCEQLRKEYGDDWLSHFMEQSV